MVDSSPFEDSFFNIMGSIATACSIESIRYYSWEATDYASELIMSDLLSSITFDSQSMDMTVEGHVAIFLSPTCSVEGIHGNHAKFFALWSGRLRASTATKLI